MTALSSSVCDTSLCLANGASSTLVTCDGSNITTVRYKDPNCIGVVMEEDVDPSGSSCTSTPGGTFASRFFCGMIPQRFRLTVAKLVSNTANSIVQNATQQCLSPFGCCANSTIPATSYNKFGCPGVTSTTTTGSTTVGPSTTPHVPDFRDVCVHVYREAVIMLLLA
jgi:hypothetical protein